MSLSRQSHMRIATRMCLILAFAALPVLVPSAAQASCAAPALASPNAFVGTVNSVEKDGRVAQVVLDDGRRVTVHGSPELGDNTATSVDRRYAVGARYEFHPLNASSPYQDNACTATRQLSGPSPRPVEPAEDRLPGWLPVDEQAGPLGYALVATALVLVLAIVAATVVRTRRRLVRRHLGAPGPEGVR